MPNNYSGSNVGQGKRKRTVSGFAGRDGYASKLSRKLFYQKGPVGAPLLNSKTIDKFVARSLRTRMIQSPEQKYAEVVGTGVALNTTTVVVLMSGMVQGDGPTNRTGNKVHVTKVEFAAYLVLSPDAVTGSDNGKIALFIYKQPNAVAPVFTAVPNSPNNAVYNSNGTSSYPLLKNALQEDQFYIIKEWDFTLDANAGVVGDWQGDGQVFKCHVPVSRIIEYNAGSAGNITDCVKNAFYLGYVGTQAAGAAQSLMTYYTRIWYTDA